MRLLIIVLSLLSFSVMADTQLRFGGFSTHLSNKDYNNFNRAVILEHNTYVAGYFYNSYYDDTFLVGKQFVFELKDGADFIITPAVTYGYREDSSCYKYQGMDNYSKRTYCPAVLLELRPDLRFKPGIVTGGNFITVTFGYDL